MKLHQLTIWSIPPALVSHQELNLIITLQLSLSSGGALRAQLENNIMQPASTAQNLGYLSLPISYF